MLAALPTVESDETEHSPDLLDQSLDESPRAMCTSQGDVVGTSGLSQQPKKRVNGDKPAKTAKTLKPAKRGRGAVAAGTAPPEDAEAASNVTTNPSTKHPTIVSRDEELAD